MKEKTGEYEYWMEYVNEIRKILESAMQSTNGNMRQELWARYQAMRTRLPLKLKKKC